MLEMKYKNVLVVGLGKSGISSTVFLHSKGVNVTVNDIKTKEQLQDALGQIEGKYEKALLGKKVNECFSGIDLIVVSPGVNFNSPWVKEAKEKGIKVVSETELAYWFIPCDIVAITGTNGKTTTTTLVGEIFKNAKRTTHVVGNIGTAITSKVNDMKKEDVAVCELSSFQILNCEKFAPKMYAFLNLTPDHLDKHITLENYADAKAKMMDVMSEDSFCVLNFNDEIVKSYAYKVKGKLLWFSSTTKVEDGAYEKDGKIYFANNGESTYIMDTCDLQLLGRHNVENVLAAICMTLPLGIKVEDLVLTLKNFKGVEHRLELVCKKDGISYINDSKGTNVDASIVGIKAMKLPTVIILGGYDKGATYEELFNHFGDKIVSVVATGATAPLIVDTAYKMGYDNIYRCDDFKQAVLKAASLAKEEGAKNVLLSPACASWDAFSNFEERGRFFKSIVKDLD